MQSFLHAKDRKGAPQPTAAVALRQPRPPSGPRPLPDPRSPPPATADAGDPEAGGWRGRLRSGASSAPPILEEQESCTAGRRAGQSRGGDSEGRVQVSAGQCKAGQGSSGSSEASHRGGGGTGNWRDFLGMRSKAASPGGDHAVPGSASGGGSSGSSAMSQSAVPSLSGN